MEECVRFPLPSKPDNTPRLVDRDELDKELLELARSNGFETYKDYMQFKNKPSDTIYYIDFKYNDTE